MAGATGYVGSRLVPELLGRGHHVVAAASSVPAPASFSWGRDVEWAQMEATVPAAVGSTLARADAVCYLVHSLARPDFTARDLRAARVMRAALDRHGVGRLVYLSGLVPPGSLSTHLASRFAVERELLASRAATLSLRAGLVIGAGSTSFEILRQVATVVLVQAIPPSLRSRVQPVGIGDAVLALADAVDSDARCGALDLGGPDVLSYADLLGLYCDLAGLVRLQVPGPAVPGTLAAGLTGLLCAAPWRTVAALVGSLQHDMVCRPAPDVLTAATSAAEAIRRALRDPGQPWEATSYGGDAYVRAASDPAWTQPPRWDGRVAGRSLYPSGVFRGLVHVAEHRLRALSQLGGAKNSSAMPSGSLNDTPDP